jgi:hypothetical protein
MAHTLQKENPDQRHPSGNSLSHAPSPTRTLDLDQAERIACLLGARAISTTLRDLRDVWWAHPPMSEASSFICSSSNAACAAGITSALDEPIQIRSSQIGVRFRNMMLTGDFTAKVQLGTAMAKHPTTGIARGLDLLRQRCFACQQSKRYPACQEHGLDEETADFANLGTAAAQGHGLGLPLTWRVIAAIFLHLIWAAHVIGANRC